MSRSPRDSELTEMVKRRVAMRYYKKIRRVRKNPDAPAFANLSAVRMVRVVAAAAVEALLISGRVALFVSFAILGPIFPAAAPVGVVSAGCGFEITVLVRTRTVP